MFFGNQEAIYSERANILPICAGDQFRPVLVRLIGGESALLLRMRILEKLCIAVGFGHRKFRIFGSANGKRQLATETSMGISSFAQCDWLYKIGMIFRENGKFRFTSLSGAGGFSRNFGRMGGFMFQIKKGGT